MTTQNPYTWDKPAPYDIEPCSSLHAQLKLRAGYTSVWIKPSRPPYTCPVSGLEECYQVKEWNRAGTVIAEHVSKEEADRLREERLVLVNREVCAGCGVTFDGRHVPEKRPIGYYGQYCSDACRESKERAIREMALARTQAGQVALVVEERYCYLVTHNGPKAREQQGSYHYSFKLLTEAQHAPDEPLYLDYCYLDREGSSLVPQRLYPLVRLALTRYEDYSKSMWAIMGIAIENGVTTPFGVGSTPVLIDLRSSQENREVVA